jgi:hypothetical protein
MPISKAHISVKRRHVNSLNPTIAFEKLTFGLWGGGRGVVRLSTWRTILDLPSLQAVNRRPPITETEVLSQTSLRGIFVVDGGALGQVLLQAPRPCFTPFFALKPLAILHHLLNYVLSFSVYRSLAGLFPFTSFSFLMGMLLIYAHIFSNTTRQSEKTVMFFGLPLSVSFHQCPMPIHSPATDAVKS